MTVCHPHTAKDVASPSRSALDRVPDEILERIVWSLPVSHDHTGLLWRAVRAHVPPELVETALTGQTALGRLMRVNKRFHSLALPVLYDDMVIRDLVTFSRSLEAGLRVGPDADADPGTEEKAVSSQMANACSRTKTLTLLDIRPQDVMHTPETRRAALTSIKLLDAALSRGQLAAVSSGSQSGCAHQAQAESEGRGGSAIFPALEHVVVRQLPERAWVGAVDEDGVATIEGASPGPSKVVYFGPRYQQARKVQDALLDLVQQLKPQSCCSYALKTPREGYPQGLMLPAMIDWTDQPPPVPSVPSPADPTVPREDGDAAAATGGTNERVEARPHSKPLLICHYSPSSAIFAAAGTRVVYDPILLDPPRGADEREVEDLFRTINEVLATFESYIAWTWNPRMRRPPPALDAEVRVPLVDVRQERDDVLSSGVGSGSGSGSGSVAGACVSTRRDWVSKWMATRSVQAGLAQPARFHEEWAAARHRAVHRFDEGGTMQESIKTVEGAVKDCHIDSVAAHTRLKGRAVLQGIADLSDGHVMSEPDLQSVVVYGALMSFTSAYIRRKTSGMLLGYSDPGRQGREAMRVGVGWGAVCGCGEMEGGERGGGALLSGEDREVLELLMRREYL